MTTHSINVPDAWQHVQFDVETGESVRAERPDSLGGPSLGEWLWRHFAY